MLLLRLFTFACRDLKNIPIGLSRRKWAVAKLAEPSHSARRTKALRYLSPGDAGLLYCNPLHSFVLPFIARSHVDPDAVVTDVWPEPWVLPFDIEPLSDGSRQVSKDIARAKWALLHRIPWKGSISATMHFTGTTTFVPLDIFDNEWK